MVINFDPPSDSVNESKLDQNLRSCDGLIAVLTWRANGPSKYILHEIALSLRARKPLVVFLDDRLSSDVLPARILQRRFSHRTFFRQSRDHSYALRALKAYMGEPPPAKYQPSSSQRICGLIGFGMLDRSNRAAVNRFITERGYQFLDLDRIDGTDAASFDKYEHLANLDVTVQFVDSRSHRSIYWRGATSAAAVPTITITMNKDYPFVDRFPREFQPRLAIQEGSQTLQDVLKGEFDLFEQDFLKAQDPETIDRYFELQKQAGMFRGRYEEETRNYFIKNIQQNIEGDQVMGNKTNEHVAGDKNVVSNSQLGALGSRARAYDIEFNGVWNQLEKSVDIVQLAEQLGRLRAAMEREATDPEHKLAVGAVAAAEQSARQNQGPKAVEYLKAGGKWALSVAEKIGVGLAVAAIKGALGA